MTAKKTKATVQVEKEHELIKTNLHEINETIGKDLAGKDFSEWKLDFMWKLRDFRNTLEKHFDFEEESGFIQEIVDRAPETLNHAKELKKEHGEIVQVLDTIITELKSMDYLQEEKLLQIREQVATFVASIREHENAENELVQKVYCQEYGYPSA